MSSSSEHRPPTDSEAELGQLVSRNLIRLAVTLVLLGLGAGAIVFHFGEELATVTEWAFATFGLGGLIGIIFFTDTFVAPFPPDTVLLLIAASEYARHWTWLIPLIGIISTCAGYCGYGFGRLLANRPVATTLLGPFREKSGELILRFGPWAVALGALTPLPFSVTCWTAGLLRLPWTRVWAPCLLRVPRYVLYYAVIGYSTQLFG